MLTKCNRLEALVYAVATLLIIVGVLGLVQGVGSMMGVKIWVW